MNKKLLIPLIFICIILPIIVANICVDKTTDIDRFNKIIEKFYSDTFDTELNYESMASFNDIKKKSKNVYVPYYNCIMGNTDNFSVDITKEVQPLQEEYAALSELSNLENFIYVSEDMEFIIDQVINEKIRSRILSDEVVGDVTWKEENNIVYLNLNDFILKQGYYEIILDGVPFRIDLESTLLTYDTYINQVIEKKNVFILESVENNSGFVVYNIKDVLLNKTFKITCYFDIFKNIVDMKIDLPFILGNSKFCYFFE